MVAANVSQIDRSKPQSADMVDEQVRMRRGVQSMIAGWLSHVFQRHRRLHCADGVLRHPTLHPARHVMLHPPCGDQGTKHRQIALSPPPRVPPGPWARLPKQLCRIHAEGEWYGDAWSGPRIPSKSRSRNSARRPESSPQGADPRRAQPTPQQTRSNVRRTTTWLCAAPSTVFAEGAVGHGGDPLWARLGPPRKRAAHAAGRCSGASQHATPTTNSRRCIGAPNTPPRRRRPAHRSWERRSVERQPEKRALKARIRTKRRASCYEIRARADCGGREPIRPSSLQRQTQSQERG